MSQDWVAMDSVGLDLLNAEFGVPATSETYLHEAAEANAPASGTVYAPNAGQPRLASLGVHEHWNNATDKKYSRDLGTGLGIQLMYVPSVDLDDVTWPLGAAGAAGAGQGGSSGDAGGSGGIAAAGGPAVGGAPSGGTGGAPEGGSGQAGSPAPNTDAGSPADGCGCHVAAVRGDRALWPLLLGLCALFRRRLSARPTPGSSG